VIRQLVGALLGASLLHLSVGRADAACASHGQEQQATGHAQHVAPPESHHGHASTEASAASGDECQTPVQEDCCQALMQCSVVLSLGIERSADGVSTTRDLAAVSRQAEPHSRFSTPETPPPRA
jgi:hypothetical protein